MTHLEKLYREVAEETGWPREEVERICRYQFLFVTEQAALPVPQQVRLPHLCSFQPMDWAQKLQAKRVAEKHLRNFHKFGFHCG